MNANIAIQADGSVTLRSFITLPALAKTVGHGDDTVARELSMRGLIPDGVVSFGTRRVPVFDAARVPDLRAALGASTV